MTRLRRIPGANLLFGSLLGAMLTIIGAGIAGWNAPPVPVYASATHGYESFAICTGFIDDGIEGLFFLDFLTGELKCTVLNSRGKFAAAFSYPSIFKDLNLENVKNPRFLMVTGVADFARGAFPLRMSRVVVYVTEITSGTIAAYGIPWDGSAFPRGQTITGTFVPLDRVPSRNIVIRPM